MATEGAEIDTDKQKEESKAEELKRLIIEIENEIDIEEPPFESIEWLYHWHHFEGKLPTPIDVSITGSIKYLCPELKWYNFDIYPHKVKITNTGYSLFIGAKWKTERPYLEGGPLFSKHILSQIHFHWGADMMEGSEHSVDKIQHPGEMQVTFFKSDYLTQEEAFRHPDGVVMVCYLIKYRVSPDERLTWVIDGFPRVREADTSTRIGPRPMSSLLPMFREDYFLYWGSLTTMTGESFVVRWLIPRTTLFASLEQVAEFRKLLNPWNEPILKNYRPLQERRDRHVFFINPHWSQYDSLFSTPRVPPPSISMLSPAYEANPWMLPPLNENLRNVNE